MHSKLKIIFLEYVLSVLYYEQNKIKGRQKNSLRYLAQSHYIGL